MPGIEIHVPSRRPRRWQVEICERLAAVGHAVTVRLVEEPRAAWPVIAAASLAFEWRMAGRRSEPLFAVRAPIAASGNDRPVDLVVDLAGQRKNAAATTFALAASGRSFEADAAATLAAGDLPQITLLRDGMPVAHAAPMVDTPSSVALALEDVLARAVTLVVAQVAALDPAADVVAPETAVPGQGPAVSSFALQYLSHGAPRLAREVLRRARYRQAHWRVGYRFHEGPGVAETGALGTGWQVLPDDGTRFFADPFAFNDGNGFHLFVEDYPHATGKAVISHVAFDGNGRTSQPRPVLEEAHHLSYPQVFARDGAIWMLPEASQSRRLTLYRADPFPDRWRPAATLVEDREISDATLLEHDGLLWLVASERDGFGSTSDTMVVFHADRLEGPWHAHPANPILIDRRRARPGGAFVMANGRLALPVQDGTLGYGGGLGLAALERLDTQAVRFGKPLAIGTAGDWPHPMVHTLNRAGPLEVIDGIAPMRKR
ncbi:glucosamine inositolphosphorylceramide transferase family protein [Pararhizobium mangrovi]|uniref:Glycoside hydrolase family 43 protein n=1 Tax=Pararhizobium mangrovi TaxID=2590452 RepID=A0A506UHQ1_9HYPH|nr:glycoside hydrolase family 43 protein [Pararhizobium mangrovi]TPW32841.1 glycoside hydrolase family 43 protein [Pararhizobium mangrovi]